MRVFMSWSGRSSNEVASALKTFLKGILQRTEPWMSGEDIQVGQRWFTEVGAFLEESAVGVLCLTRDNLQSPWLHFEAGALSKKVDKSLVCPYLLELEPTDVAGPIAGFQAVRANEEGTRKLVKTINGALGEAKLDDATLSEAFNLWWPSLEKKLKGIQAGPRAEGAGLEVRRDRDLLEEVLLIVRKLGKDQRRTATHGARTHEPLGLREIKERRISTILSALGADEPSSEIMQVRDKLERLGLAELDVLRTHLREMPPSLRKVLVAEVLNSADPEITIRKTWVGEVEEK